MDYDERKCNNYSLNFNKYKEATIKGARVLDKTKKAGKFIQNGCRVLRKSKYKSN